MATENLRAHLTDSLWIRGLLTIAVLAILTVKIDMRATGEALLRLSPAAIVAVLALLVVDRGVMVWRWIILLRARGAAVTTKSATWIYLVSSFVGGFLPAGVGADAARAFTLSQRTARGSEAVASVAVDRLLGLLSIIVMGVVGAVVAGRQMDGTPRLLLPATAIVVVSGSVAMLWADRVMGAILPGGMQASGPGKRLMRLADAVSLYRGHRGALASVAVLSIAVQVLRIVQAYLLGRGIGIDVPFSYYLLFMPIGLIALLLPISISGIGAPQGIIVWLLAPAGVPQPQALALSTLIVLSGIVANLPGAWLYLAGGTIGASGRIAVRGAIRGVTVVLLIFAGGSCARLPHEKQPLLDVYMPSFSQAPPREPAMQSIRTLARDWREGGRTTITSDVLSAQGRGLALALVVILAVAWDFRRAAASRNIDLALMFASGALFFDVMRFFRVIHSPTYLNLLDWVFIAIVFVNLALIVRTVIRVKRRDVTPWTPNLPVKFLAPLAIALLLVDVAVALARPPDDAGWFANLGAQRLRERGRLPYGDPLLTATPGAAYGPLLYAAHVPFQILLSPDPVNPVSPDRPNLTSGTPYYLPPAMATQICTIAFHLAGVLALFVAARRLADARVAWGLVCLYCGSLAIIGIGGPDDQVAGITFVSHVAPASMTLLAFAALKSPAISGTLLAMSTGVGFYPAFMAPAWLGFYWNDVARRTRFAIGFGLAAAIIAGGVYAMSRPAGERSRLGTIMYDTFGHHTDPRGYGSSVFGFWGQREGIRRVLGTPLIGGSGFTSPAWLAFAAFLVATFFLARGRSAAELALLAGAVAIGATLIKPHATGSYLAWAYPLLLLGLVTSGFTLRPQKV